MFNGSLLSENTAPMESSEYPPYICTLDEESQKKALKELYEDPKNRQGAIDTFREWIKQQKHMKCPMDNVFLLGFLRAKHFSQLEAREALERFMGNRERFPNWMKGIDTGSEDFLDIIKRGGGLILPKRDRDNRKVFIAIRKIVPDKQSIERMCRFMAAISYNNYLCDEMDQVHGTVSIIDWTGHSMAKELRIPMDLKKNSMVILQKTFPSRLKAIHQYNTGPVMDIIMNIVVPLLTETMKQRVHIHTNLESLYEYVDKDVLPREYLPDDYDGPDAGTIDQVKDLLMAHYQKPEVREESNT